MTIWIHGKWKIILEPFLELILIDDAQYQTNLTFCSAFWLSQIFSASYYFTLPEVDVLVQEVHVLHLDVIKAVNNFGKNVIRQSVLEDESGWGFWGALRDSTNQKLWNTSRGAFTANPDLKIRSFFTAVTIEKSPVIVFR